MLRSLKLNCHLSFSTTINKSKRSSNNKEQQKNI